MTAVGTEEVLGKGGFAPGPRKTLLDHRGLAQRLLPRRNFLDSPSSGFPEDALRAAGEAGFSQLLPPGPPGWTPDRRLAWGSRTSTFRPQSPERAWPWA